MNRIRSWVRAFFGFSRNETNAFLVLLPLMFLIVFMVPAYKNYFTRQPKDYAQEKRQLDSLIANWKQPVKKDSSKNDPIRLFAFNPNTASKEELMSLGFPPFVASRVENYRSKGGKFIIKSDLLKLYGMDTALYSTLYAWIELPVEKPLKKFEEKKEFETNRKLVGVKFDLNLADSTQFISVYGIGSKLSSRIIKYRDRLGGFISTDQLKELYGLDTVVIKELILKTFIAENYKPATLELNSATEKELATHPYIRYSIAKAITAYRFQHGSFKSIEDLTQIAIVDKPTFEKIKPYLSLNPERERP
jgi:competence protein ComEA